MQFSGILAIFGLVVSTSATCYTSGVTVTTYDQDFAYGKLNSVCTQIIDQGNYTDNGESRQICVTEGSNLRWDFEVTHISNGDRALGLAEFINGLYKEIHGCSHGGRSSYTNWEYKSDINNGTY